MQEIIVNAVAGVATGLVTGLYVGLIMAKYNSFCQVRLSIFSICRGISYGGVNGELKNAEFNRYVEIVDGACNFLYLGHAKAGEHAIMVYKEIADTKYAIEFKFKHMAQGKRIPEVNIANITLDDLSRKHSNWQKRIIELQPSLISLLSLKSRL